MALILHIETATSVCSAALSRDGLLLGLKESNDPRSHASLLSPFIEDLLQDTDYSISDLDAISVSLGPGSYTGLRIGVSTVKGLAFGSNLPVIGVPTLQALTNRVLVEKRALISDLNSEKLLLCPMIDARRMEVYSAFYSSGLEVIRGVQADIIELDSYKEYLDSAKVLFFGNGSDKCKEVIKHPNALYIDGIEPSGKFMIQLADSAWERSDFVNTAYFEPFYLKDFIATVPKNNILPH